MDLNSKNNIETILKNAGVDVTAPDILDCAAICLLLVGVDRHVVYANQALCELLGYAERECVGRHINMLVAPESLDEVNRRHEDLLQGNSNRYVSERSYVHKDGSIIPVLSSVFIYSDDAMEPQLVAVQLVDVRAQKEAENALSDNKRRLEFALESSRQGVWDSDRIADTVYYSRMWYEIRGLANNDSLELKAEWSNRIHPDDFERVTKLIEKQDNGYHSEGGFEYRERHADGHWIWLLSRGRAVEWDENGKPTRIIGTDTDITRLKQSELKLEEISSRLELALETSRVGVWEMDIESGRVQWDQSIKEIYGRYDIDGHDVPEELWQSMLHPDDAEMTIEASRCGIESKSDAEWMCRIVLPDGRIRHIQTMARYYVDASGAPKFLGIDRDITNEMTAAQEISQAKDNAEQKNALLEIAHASMESMSHRLEIALSVSKVGVWELNLDTDEAKRDDRASEIYGFSEDEKKNVTNEMLFDRVHPDDLERVKASTKRTIADRSSNEIDYRVVRPNGDIRYLRAFSRYYVDSEGGQRILGVDRDITEEALAAEELRQAKELSEQRNRELETAHAGMEKISFRLEMALTTSGVGVWELDIHTGHLVWDETVRTTYGRDDIDIDNVPPNIWVTAMHPDDLDEALALEAQALASQTRLNVKFRIIRPNGSIRHIQSSAQFYVDPDGSPKFIGVDRDITDEVSAAEELKEANILAEQKNAQLEVAHANMEFNSLHDALTGLPNRRFLDETLRSFTNVENGAALLHIDLDRFKQINDTLGHAAGDAMLIYAADVLRQNVAQNDFVARVGGDEFVVFVSAPKTQQDLASMANRIINKMSEPVDYQGHECRFGVSIGITTEEGADIDSSQMLVNADIALYRAKERGRNRHEFFTRALQAEIVETKQRADEILTALEQGQFFAYYQPQFDSRSFAIVGVEALARWDHPTEGILTPDKFLKIAEDLNVVAKIDRIILEHSVKHLEEWFEKDLEIPKVSVNVSSRRLQDEELIESLSKLNFRPGSLSFELLESIFLDESDELMVWNIDQLKELGIGIDIDDFGTGHASIVGLLKLSPDRLKIDQQLIKPIAHSRKQRSLVKSIIEIGKSLGIQIVAEGVETMEHVRILQLLGCDTLQGYAFAKPMSAEDLEQFALTKTWGKVIPSLRQSG